MSRHELTNRLKSEAIRLGFDAVGIAPAVTPPGYPDFQRWLDSGHAAGMDYLRRNEAARAHPRNLLEGVRSVIMVSVVYGQNRGDAVEESRRRGKVARYARGGDYHALIWRKLEELLEWLHGECPAVAGRAVADTAPLLERDFARLAGLGWIGKNTMLIDRQLGSFTFLGALLVDIELEYDRPAPGRPLRKLHAVPGPLPDAGFHRPYRARCPPLHQLLDDRAQGGYTRGECVRSSTGGFLAATSARMSARGTARRPTGSHAELEPRTRVDGPGSDRVAIARPVRNGGPCSRELRCRRAKRSGLVRNAGAGAGQPKAARGGRCPGRAA